MAEQKCVGFADCPCLRCRRFRLSVTDAHPNHHPNDWPYCGVCRTKEQERYRA